MFKMLFILLICETASSFNYMSEGYKHMVWKDGIGTIDNEIIDTWSTSIQSGDYVSPGSSHYKAVLFSSKDALHRYLDKNKSDGSLLIDIKMQTQRSIVQTEIMRAEEVKVFDHYKWEIK